MDAKFRVWDDLNKKWLLGYDYPNLGGFSMMGEVMMFGEYTQMLNSFRLEDWKQIKITEFTKTQDRFKVDLYDGDIIQPLRDIGRGWGKGLNFTIIYDPIHNRWGAHWKGHEKKESAFFITPANSKNVKKIGNVFENLSLI